MVVITMNSGKKIEIELYPQVAPITCENFEKLAKEGFYNGLTFHRVIKGYMIQGGCPNADSTGGPGYTIKGEFTSNGVQNDISHTPGVISMARAFEPDTAGSQFFIMHGTATRLDGEYAAFGKVVKGMDVVEEIATAPTDENDKPYQDMIMEKVEIV